MTKGGYGGDYNTCRWQATITISLSPKNIYDDPTGDGDITFSKVISRTSLTEIAVILEEIK